jgi:hypothetical protein
MDKQTGCISTEEYYSALRRCEVYNMQHGHVVTCIETESWQMVAGGQGEGRLGVTAYEQRAFSGSDESALD